MTGGGEGGGFWVKKAVEQPLRSSAADRTNLAGKASATPMPGIRRRARIVRASRRMGLGPARWAVPGPSAQGQVDGHPDAEMRPRIFSIHDLHRAAVRGDELQHDGEADSGALDGGGLGRPAGVERLEDVIAVFLGDAGAVVGDIHDEGVRGSGGFDVNGASLRGVFDGIRHQVFEYEAD